MMERAPKPWSPPGLEDVFISATHSVTETSKMARRGGVSRVLKEGENIRTRERQKRDGRDCCDYVRVVWLDGATQRLYSSQQRESAQIKEERGAKMEEQGLLFFSEYLFLVFCFFLLFFSFPLPSFSCLCHCYLCKDRNQASKQQRTHKYLLPWFHNTWTVRREGRSWHKQLISSLTLLSLCDLSFCPVPVLCAV